MKVVIADAQELFRKLLSRWISDHPEWTLIHETGSGVSAYQCVLKEPPELLIVDPLLPGMSGFALGRMLRRELPDLRQMALYARGEPFLIDRMRRVGFQASIHKPSCSLADLERAVKALMDGRAYYCAETCRAQNLLYNDETSFVRLLSLREQHVLSLIGAGMSNEEIGLRLGLSPATVQTHRRNLFRKLRFHDTPSLMRFAIVQGFWHPDYERLNFDPWSL